MAVVPGVKPLGYVGIKENNPPNIFFRERDPDQVTFKDFRNYDIGDLWQNTLTFQWFILISKKVVNVGGVFVTQGVWVSITGLGTGSIQTINGIPPAAFGNFNINAASGILITPGINSISVGASVDGTTITFNGFGQLQATIPASFAWQDVAVNTVMLPNNGYFTSGGAPLLMTLPAAATQGSIIEIAGKSGQWQVNMSGAQQVQVFSQMTSLGGTITSNNSFDTIRMVCSTTNTNWTTLSAGGNVTVL